MIHSSVRFFVLFLSLFSFSLSSAEEILIEQILSHEREYEDRTYKVPDAKKPRDLLDLDESVELNRKTDRLMAVYQHRTSKYAETVTLETFRDGRKTGSVSSDDDGDQTETAPGFEGSPGRSFLALVKRKKTVDGKKVFVPVFIHDYQVEIPTFDPKSSPPKIFRQDLVDFDFQVEAEFVEGDWTSFRKGKEVKFRLAPSGVESLKKHLGKWLKLFHERSNRASVAFRAQNHDPEVSDVQIDQLELDYKEEEKDTGVFFSGTKKALKRSLPETTVVVSFTATLRY